MNIKAYTKILLWSGWSVDWLNGFRINHNAICHSFFFVTVVLQNWRCICWWKGSNKECSKTNNKYFQYFFYDINYQICRCDLGLDPALPLFSSREASKRLDPTDALTVDCIHSCGGYLGFYTPLCTHDFYPNKGSPAQPGCSWDLTGTYIISTF